MTTKTLSHATATVVFVLVFAFLVLIGCVSSRNEQEAKVRAGREGNYWNFTKHPKE